MERITSRQNPLWTHLRKLQGSKAYRYETGQFIADGTKLLDEAIRWYLGLEMVILDEKLPVPKLPQQVRVVQVPSALMQSISSMKTPQGAIFICRMPEPKPLAVQPGCLILDGLQDPGNLGTILRTADALAVPVLLSDGCADPYGEKTVRASMGAVLRTQPQQATAQQIHDACRAQGIGLAVTALSDRAQDLCHAPLKDLAVVIGSEGQGVGDFFRRRADLELIIPMQACCESLNAAVAATIVMWEMKR